MAADNFLGSGKIAVSRKTLLHISEGIYRTEGSSLKELISNSFDANARRVVVNTNYPQFDILTVQDDGDGMTEDEFLRIVNGGIGDSPKSNLKKVGRPLIGRLGIGILSIAQICRSFTIISHCQKSRSAFKGRMIFRTDVDEVAKGENKQSYDIGFWELDERIDYDESKKGVLIFTKDLRQSFLKRFRESKAVLNQNENSAPIDFEKLLDLFYNNDYKMVKEQGPYYELIWELCNLLPLPYFDSSPVRSTSKRNLQVSKKDDEDLTFKTADRFIKSKNEELLAFDFAVIFDDIKLYRPIQLPSPLHNKTGDIQNTQLFYFEYDNVVRKRKLRCYGYFLAQEMAIKPRDLKGVQIRIKNIGIGTHDSTFMKYDKIEAPRDNWLTGEIYVEEGLESALNIDRDSFNENDEHYYILKEQIHKYLGTVVFPTISSFQRKRNKEKRQLNRINYLDRYRINIETTFEKYFSNFKIEYNKSKSIQIDSKKKIVSVPLEMLTTDSVVKMDIFLKSAVNLLDFMSSKYSDSSYIESAFKDISKVILA